MEVARQWYCKKVITTLLFAPEIKKKKYMNFAISIIAFSPKRELY